MRVLDALIGRLYRAVWRLGWRFGYRQGKAINRLGKE